MVVSGNLARTMVHSEDLQLEKKRRERRGANNNKLGTQSANNHPPLSPPLQFCQPRGLRSVVFAYIAP